MLRDEIEEKNQQKINNKTNRNQKNKKKIKYKKQMVGHPWSFPKRKERKRGKSTGAQLFLIYEHAPDDHWLKPHAPTNFFHK